MVLTFWLQPRIPPRTSQTHSTAEGGKPCDCVQSRKYLWFLWGTVMATAGCFGTWLQATRWVVRRNCPKCPPLRQSFSAAVRNKKST